MIKGLLLKDYYTNKSDIISSLIFCAALPVLSLIVHAFAPAVYSQFWDTEETAIFFLLLASFTPICVAASLYKDEKCGFINQAYVSPMTRQDYMKSKYVLMVICMAVTFLSMVAFGVELMSFIYGGMTVETMKKFALMIFIFLCLEVITSTFIISLSAKTSIGVTLIVLMVMVFVGSLMCGFVIGFLEGIEEETGKTVSLNSVLLVGCSIAAVIELFLFAMGFRWAKRRDL